MFDGEQCQHDEFNYATVTDAGALNVDGAQIQVGLALARERITLQPLVGSAHRLWFRDLDLGTVDLPPSNRLIDDVALEHLKQPFKGTSKKKAA